jgi:hypothetical protein
MLIGNFFFNDDKITSIEFFMEHKVIGSFYNIDNIIYFKHNISKDVLKTAFKSGDKINVLDRINFFNNKERVSKSILDGHKPFKKILSHLIYGTVTCDKKTTTVQIDEIFSLDSDNTKEKLSKYTNESGTKISAKKCFKNLNNSNF